MRSNYRSTILKELRDQQVRFAPRDRKIEQANRAETLIAELDRDKSYPYEFVFYRITDIRPETFSREKLAGEDLLHDLRLLVEELSDAANISAEDTQEKVLTVPELAKEFQVSTKTISRWRERGLVSRRFLFNGRKRIGFLQSSIDRFVSHNEDRVRRGAKFTQLSKRQRTEVIDIARKMARTGGCPMEVARRIAKRTGRSVETIRQIVKQFDQEHPALAVFPGKIGTMDETTKGKIFLAYRQGTSVPDLSKKFCRTKTTIYRVINEVRVNRILELPLEFMPNPRFSRRGADKACLGPMPEAEKPTRKPSRPSGLPPYLASLYEMPLLTREQEVHLFRKYNYLKYKTSKLREKLDISKPKAVLMDEIERLYELVVEVKNEIVRANLRLVVSIAKRHIGKDHNFFELISDGNISLLRAIEKFDFARGNKFSTYATWAIMKNFARTIPKEFKHRDRFRTSTDELFGTTQEHRGNPVVEENAQSVREFQIGKILHRLDERERQIIIERFGLDHSQESQTLKEIGASFGVTKERIRQIEAKALNKLRVAAQEEKIDFELDI